MINKRAGGMGLISGRKAFQRPMKEGVALLNAIQDVYLSTIARRGVLTVASGANFTPSHRATTAVARQFPSTFTDVRAMSISVSTPRITAIPSIGRLKRASVPARITSDARGTPATPLLVSISVSIITSCVPNGMATSAACATNIAASDKIERGAVQIEAVAGRQHERHDVLRHAECFHVFERDRQRRFAR